MRIPDQRSDACFRGRKLDWLHARFVAPALSEDGAAALVLSSNLERRVPAVAMIAFVARRPRAGRSRWRRSARPGRPGSNSRLTIGDACAAPPSRQPHRAPARSAPERSGLLRVSPAAAHAHSLLETAVRDAVRHRRAREPSSPGGAAAPAYIGTDRAPSVVTSAPLAAICEPPALVGSGRGEEEPSGRCLGSGADPLPARVSRAQPGSRRPARRCADRRSRSRPAWC
jgi:hypothetical protein